MIASQNHGWVAEQPGKAKLVMTRWGREVVIKQKLTSHHICEF